MEDLLRARDIIKDKDSVISKRRDKKRIESRETDGLEESCIERDISEYLLDIGFIKIKDIFSIKDETVEELKKDKTKEVI